MNKKSTSISKTCAVILSSLVMILGCEPSDSEVRGELEVSPDFSMLSESSPSVLLSVESVGEGVDGIVYPLEWSVVDPAAGRIVGRSARKAVYVHQSSSVGTNTIIVRDQLGREGIASVTWVAD